MIFIIEQLQQTVPGLDLQKSKHEEEEIFSGKLRDPHAECTTPDAEEENLRWCLAC
jgi:hypothetical protein